MKYALSVLALTLLMATAPKPALVVHMVDFSFKPASATVHVGDTVQFVNDDSYPHTVTASDGSFDSGNLDEHKSWSYTFKKAGTYTLLCTYHPNMKGMLTVR